MSYTTQCHQPLPVGASGSCTSSAKLLVSDGAPLHESAGETLLPLQPNSLNTCALAMVPPSVRSVLVRVNLPMAPVSFAAGGAAAHSVATRAIDANQAGAIHAGRFMAPQISDAGGCRRAAVC